MKAEKKADRATGLSTASRFPASLVRLAPSRSRIPAVLSFDDTVAYLFLVRPKTSSI
jgi:hypothetical protein